MTFGSANVASPISEFNGRKMVVRMDNRGADRPPRQPRQPRVPAADAAPGEVKATNDGSFPLFVGNLPWSTSWQDLKDLAKAQGLNPTRADVTMGHDGKSRGWGTLAFATLEEAHKAIEVLNGHELEGRQMEVREDRKRQ